MPLTPLARAGRNLAFKTLGELGGRVSFVALFIVAARLLGASEYGRYSYASSLAALAFIGMDLGLNTILVRDGARDRAAVGTYAGTVLLLKLGLALVVLLALLGFSLAAGYPAADLALIMAVAGVLVLWGVCELGVAGLGALELMDREAWVKTSSRLVALLAGLGLMLAGWGVWGLVAGLALANALAAWLALGYLRRQVDLRLRLEGGFLGYLFRQALPLAFTSVFILVYTRVDVVMLELMGRGYAEIGWYAAAFKVLDGVAMLPNLVAAALLPVVSHLSQSDPEAMRRLYRQGLRLLLALGLPAGLGLWAVRREVAVLVYGPEFAEAGRALAWLGPVLPFLFVNYLQLTLLTALGRQQRAALATAACLVVNVGLNLWWIPRWGYAGAAAATLATEVVLMALCAWFLAAEAGLPTPLAPARRPALAALPMAAFLALGLEAHVLVVIGLAALVYALAALAFRVVTREELVMLWGMIRARGRVEEEEAV